MKAWKARFGAGAVFTALLLLFLLGACGDLNLEDAQTYSYETEAVPIVNFDWNIIPLPNNLVNAPAQTRMQISIPGVPGVPKETMELPVFTEEAAQKAIALGYTSVQADSELTQSLVKGMNRLNGFIPGFIPRIPFSQPIDPASIVRYKVDKDGVSNVDKANIFLLDVTETKLFPDMASPKLALAYPPLDSNGDVMVFNLEGRTEKPYYLTFRNRPTGSFTAPRGMLPMDYTPGHTYMIVVTGYNENGLKAADGRPVKADPTFLLLASDVPYIAPDGSPRCSLFSDINQIRQLEGARQITRRGLEVWKELVGETRSIGEVVVAFHFTISTNPMAYFLDPSKVLMGGSPVLPKPADEFKPGATEPSSAKAATDVTAEFSVPTKLAEATVAADSVKLFTLNQGKPTFIEATVALPQNDAGLAKVTIEPKAALSANTTYWVAVNNKLKGPNPLNEQKTVPSVDETYFGLSRSSVALIDGQGNLGSPQLDSRVDSLLSPLVTVEEYAPGVLKPTEEQIAKTGEELVKVIGVIELVRQYQQEAVDALLEDKTFIAEREELTLMWRFTTAATTTKSSEGE